MDPTIPPVQILYLQSIPDRFFDFKNCLVDGLICINFTDRRLLKFQVGAPGMAPAYVILWFLFAARGIPQKRNSQWGIKVNHQVRRRDLSVEP